MHERTTVCPPVYPNEVLVISVSLSDGDCSLSAAFTPRNGTNVDAPIAIFVGIWVAIVAFASYHLYVWARCRLSPKYATQRKLREDAKLTRDMEKRRKRRVSREDRLRVWAEDHPDDPAAKALLTEKPSLTVVTPNDDKSQQNLQEVLNQRQREADDLERRMDARRAAEAILNQQLLEWAKKNPSTPEGKRHLVEQLLAADKEVGEANSTIRFSYFSGEEESSEGIAYAIRVADAEARRATAQRTINEIQAILTALPDN